MTRAERGQPASRPPGTWTPLTSLVGRAKDAPELSRLLEDNRLVTVTGPGGVGKTRLATELARRVRDRFPDGVWFIELGAAAEAAEVTAEVMSALGVRQDPGRPPLKVLAEVLAPRRLLLVLDSCEHVLPATAELCGVLLGSSEELRVLATSREQLGLGGEAWYRLSPLELPTSDEPEAVRESAAAVLFAERAGRGDPGFTLSRESAPLVARVVSRLDGMPLAIELAAARLVDCSLLVPPRLGADRRTRYTMLQTLRAYALTRLREAGEELQATAALVGFASSVAEQATAELEASGTELGALRWLDAEDATLSRAMVLTEIGELDSARRICAAGLARARQADDLTNLVPLLEVMADLERLAGNPATAGAHLREALDVASVIGLSLGQASLIEQGGYLCAATGRWADAVTLWAALAADWKRRGRPTGPVNEGQRARSMLRIERALQPGQLREAEERGAAMPFSAAVELAIMVANAVQQEPGEPAAGRLLSPRERELVTLVARGRTNAEIATELYISVRTVTSHLDRIRDKTGYRRRADLTRLALEESLV